GRYSAGQRNRPFPAVPGRIFSEVPAAPELHDKPVPDGVLPSAWIQPPGLWTGPYVFPARSGVPVSMSRAAGGALACEADWLCVYIHVCCADVAPHTAPCARVVPQTAPPSVTDADRPVRVERSTSDGHIQRDSQGQPSRLCIPCIHKVPEAAERVLAHPACGSVLHGFDCRTPSLAGYSCPSVTPEGAHSAP